MDDNLLSCSLFKGLNCNSLNDLLEGIKYFEKKFGKDEIIANAEAEVRSLMILTSGAVRGEMADYSGKTVKIEDIESPNLLAPAFLFGKNNKYPVSIIANNEVSVLSIPKQDFVKLLQKNESILNNYLDNISSRAQFLSGKLRFLAFQTIKGKLAHYFLQILNQSGKDEFLLPKSQSQLAEMFGVARPSLSRAIRELDNDGIIQASGKRVLIKDKDKLKKFLK
jgi:CRP/FNR family transcriptional regulator, dissimilatory nitrate respiration regulator